MLMGIGGVVDGKRELSDALQARAVFHACGNTETQERPGSTG